jgi:hypothetical protein
VLRALLYGLRALDRVRYHGFLVLCSAQGISSGGCLPTMLPIPNLGTIHLAKAADGHMLTSVDPIEPPAFSGVLTLFDTGGSIHRHSQTPVSR